MLARLGFDRLIANAGYPGSEMVPATSAMLSLLALKLLDKERRSHIDDFNDDEALGVFAGLNVLPKKTFATDYSYRTGRDQQLGLLQGWVKALAPVMFPATEGFSLDFHPIPYRGDPAALDRHYLPRRGKAGASVLTFFALEQSSRCLCYANANLTRADQHGELMRFVEFWHEVIGSDPKWLYFDSKVVDYPELSRINQRKIHFVTIRRRGGAILRSLKQQPASAWKGSVIDIPKRCHTQIRYIEEVVRLRGYEGPIRQIAVTGLGRERPTLVLSNHFEETPRELIIRYAGRNRIEDGLGISVNFFHLDCLASEVRLNVGAIPKSGAEEEVYRLGYSTNPNTTDDPHPGRSPSWKCFWSRKNKWAGPSKSELESVNGPRALRRHLQRLWPSVNTNGSNV